MKLLIPIIPVKQHFYHTETKSLKEWSASMPDVNLDLKAIAKFVALGFFLGDSTYFKEIKVIPYASKIELEGKKINKIEKYWHWCYEPRNLSLNDATEEFSSLIEEIIGPMVRDKNVILPLSGGIDSRSLAAAIPDSQKVIAYSYQFQQGLAENRYGRSIAQARNFAFKDYEIQCGYLWNVIDELANLNNCFSDFTHPRQMAVIDELESLGDSFLLGHWGDVLFDGFDLPEELSFEARVNLILSKIVKKGGVELGKRIWEVWGLEGSFEDDLKAEVSERLAEIKIENPNAQIRAFKSIYWCPRWTSVNLKVFNRKRDIHLPYYHNDLCKFITRIPEKWLIGRQIQIEYIKRKYPQLARIEWQDFYPLNLYNYKNYYKIHKLPERALRKIGRTIKHDLLRMKFYKRNWELQFQGMENDKHLQEYLFEKETFKAFLPIELVKEFYDLFRATPQKYSHPLSMLLTLSVFSSSRNS